jgi:hypothetical protein
VAENLKEDLMTSAQRSLPLARPAVPKPTLAFHFAALAVAIAFALPLGGCGLVDSMDGVNTACKMKTTGIAAQAEILSTWETGMRVNDEPVIGMHVRVLADDRPPFEVDIKRSLVDIIHIPQFQPGSKVPVIYDPKDPTKIGLDVYRCD